MEFQKGGVFTQHIDRMRLGDKSMKIIGIGGEIAYLGNNDFSIKSDSGEEAVKQKKRVGMIAAGSGISPMFQLVQTVADIGNSDSTSLSLIYSNRTPVSLF